MTDFISILDSNILNIKKNLQQLTFMINNTKQISPTNHNNPLNKNIPISSFDKNINSNKYLNYDQHIDVLLNKYKSNDDSNYMENKLKKLLSVYSS